MPAISAHSLAFAAPWKAVVQNGANDACNIRIDSAHAQKCKGCREQADLDRIASDIAAMLFKPVEKSNLQMVGNFTCPSK
jgi:hypothetical protein